MAPPKWINNRYQLMARLGSGGSSTIYRARDRKDPDERLVALKILGQMPTHNRDLLQEMFAREVHALLRLSHPSIVQIYDYGYEEEADLLYLVLEHVERADTLRNRIPKWRPDITQCTEILIELLDAVGYAHGIHVIHRDLNPSNILIDEDGSYKIIDFGVSKILGDLTAQQTVGEMYTRAYASPEQKSHGMIGPQSDLYSLAALFYFLVTHQDPAEDRPLADQFDSLTKSDAKVIPKDLLEVIKRLAAATPSERYHTTFQAKVAVERVQRAMQVDTTQLYVQLTRNAVNKLAEQLVIDGPDAQAACGFVSSALSGEVYITLEENSTEPSYYLLGDSLSLQCKIGSDASGRKLTHFLVIGLTASIPPHEFERRRQASYPVQARWRVGAPGEPTPMTFDSLSGLLDQIDEFFHGRALEIKKHERRLDLVESWRTLLSLDRDIQKEGTTQVNYLSWEPINNHAVLKVHLAQKDTSPETELFPAGELLQMTSKNRRTIRVGHCLGQDANTILISRLPDLSLDIIASSGTLTIDDSQWAAAWNRQRAALDILLDGRSQNPRLPEILLAPANATYLLQEPIETYFNQDLDEAKREAVNAALGARDLYLIQGPPGTGKTILIAEIITQLLTQHPNAKVLLVSQSNVAADHVLLALTELLATSSIDRDIVRVGREAAVSSEMKSLLITNQLEEWTNEIKHACNAYLLERFPESKYRTPPEHVSEIIESVINLLKSPLPNDDEVSSWVELLRQHFDNEAIVATPESMYSLLKASPKTALETALQEWMLRVGSVNDLHETYLNACSVIAGTCVGIAGVTNLPASFDWVIIDEAGRATPSELLIPLVRGRHAILVGDHKQLPPVIEHTLQLRAAEREDIDSTWLSQSLFEYLFLRLPANLKTTLRTQYRMHPQIAALVSSAFYSQENLNSGVDAGARSHQWTRWSAPVVWYSTSGLDNRQESSDDSNSKFNLCEAGLIATQINDLEQHLRSINARKTVAVIAGYSAQISLLKRNLDPDDVSRWQAIDLEINTVDAFQGRERDIVFYSVVRSNKKREIGFLADARRLNVALSRAREMLFIVGDHRMVSEADVRNGKNPFTDVIKHIFTHPAECLLVEVEP